MVFTGEPPSPKLQLKLLTSLRLRLVVKVKVVPLQMAVSEAINCADTSITWMVLNVVYSQPDALFTTLKDVLNVPLLL